MTLYYLPQYKTTSLNAPGGITNSQTTGIILNDVTNVDTSKPGIIAISYSVPVDMQKVEYVSYTSINGSKELVGVTRGIDNFTAKSHNDGAVVAFVISASHINEINNTITANNNFMLTKALSEGEMINGKIVPSVSSNNLTVALKTLAGNDPSASDPIYVRIGDTVRTITSALSTTALQNASNNWANAGSAELAGKEVDYFVYLGYNSTDGVIIGASRLPYAKTGADVSGNVSSEKLLISNWTTNKDINTTLVNVGRFAATLSGSPFNWSVPTFNATNLIQRPIYETRKLTWEPTYTGFSSAPSGGSVYYIVRNDTVFINHARNDGTSNANNLRLTLPFKALISNHYSSGTTRDNGAYQAYTSPCYLEQNTNLLLIYKSTSQTDNFTTSGNKIWVGTLEYLI